MCPSITLSVKVAKILLQRLTTAFCRLLPIFSEPGMFRSPSRFWTRTLQMWAVRSLIYLIHQTGKTPFSTLYNVTYLHLPRVRCQIRFTRSCCMPSGSVSQLSSKNDTATARQSTRQKSSRKNFGPCSTPSLYLSRSCQSNCYCRLSSPPFTSLFIARENITFSLSCFVMENFWWFLRWTGFPRTPVISFKYNVFSYFYRKSAKLSPFKNWYVSQELSLTTCPVFSNVLHSIE